MDITFNLQGIKIKLNNGASLEEVANMLQNFTFDYLYVENGVLKKVDKIQKISYEKCNLIEIHNGYVLQEKETKREITVFNKDFVEFLLEDSSSTSSEEYFYPENIRNCFEDIEIENAEKKLLHENTIDEAETSSTETSSTETFSTENNLSEEKLKFETRFRLYMKPEDDETNSEMVCINFKILKYLNMLNDINIEETIKLSFLSFLESKNYKNIKVSTIFKENVFCEVLINTIISKDVIKEIEKEAILPINENEVIFFLYQNTENNLCEFPEELINIIQDRAKNLPLPEDSVEFYFNDSIFVLKKEKENLFSLFDIEDLLQISTDNFKDIPKIQFSI
jgi:hypothetical protein